MIPSFEVQNYRLFKHLTIDKLARVNLITGKNNVGKTALLEAVRLYSTQAMLWDVLRVLRGRNINAEFTEEHIRNLFIYKVNADSMSETIVLGQKDDAESIEIKLIGFEERIEDGRITRLKGDPESGAKPGLEVSFHGKSRIMPLSTKKDDSLSYGFSTDRKPHKCFYISSNSLEMSSFFKWWDDLVIASREEEVLYPLRIVEPKLMSLATIGGESNAPRKFVAKIKNVNATVSLDSLGEGLIRLLRIIIALVSAKNDTLCIDEIENGLHYSTLADIWNVILNNAEKMNVQVFASTHSRECVDAFQRVLNQHLKPESGKLIRLKEKNGDIISTVFEANELEIAIRESLEVR